jgi:hypothetical protein
MYHFIYWYFYKYFTSRGRRSSSLATYMVGFAFIMHVGLLYTVIRKLTGWSVDYPLKKYEYGIRKYVLILMAVLLFELANLIYFKKRRLKILTNYNGQTIKEPKNIALMLLALPLPVVLVFWLLN